MIDARLGVLTLAFGTASAAARVHDEDYLIRVHGGRLQLGAVDGGWAAVYPSPVKGAVLGAEGPANFTDEPGIDSEPGLLVPGMAVGFDIAGALRVWDGVTFDTIAMETVTVRAGGVTLGVTPALDERVPGDVFGTADNDAAAVFHHHVQFFLDYPSATPVDGVWLFRWVLWTDETGVGETDTGYIVFAQGSGEAELDDALAWVEANLVAPPCFADCDASGVLNVDDVACFVAAFVGGGQPGADCDGSGVLNVDDVECFVGGFLGGCP